MFENLLALSFERFSIGRKILGDGRRFFLLTSGKRSSTIGLTDPELISVPMTGWRPA